MNNNSVKFTKNNYLIYNNIRYKPLIDNDCKEIYNFRPNNFYDIKESYSSNVKDLNYSSVLTELIQYTGRFVEHYASDLFIDWGSIIEFLNNDFAKIDSKTYKRFCFGLRNSGVDGNSFISCKLKNEYNYSLTYEYRAIFCLDIIKEEDNYIRMILFKSL